MSQWTINAAATASSHTDLGSSLNCTYSAPTAANSLLLAWVAWNIPGQFPSLADNVNGAWIAAAPITAPNTGWTTRMFFLKNFSLAGTPVVTATMDGGSGNIEMIIVAYAGGTTIATDGGNSSTSAPSSVNSQNTSTFTTSATDLIVVGLQSTGGSQPTVSAPAGYTDRFDLIWNNREAWYDNNSVPAGVQQLTMNATPTAGILNISAVAFLADPLPGSSTNWDILYEAKLHVTRVVKGL